MADNGEGVSVLRSDIVSELHMLTIPISGHHLETTGKRVNIPVATFIAHVCADTLCHIVKLIVFPSSCHLVTFWWDCLSPAVVIISDFCWSSLKLPRSHHVDRHFCELGHLKASMQMF